MTDQIIRLVQISDCHLPADRNKPYRGKNADTGLESLLDKVAAWSPQQVLVTGDLSEDASDASYQRLGGYLSRIGAPICVLPGNHDDNQVMQRHFPIGPWNGPLMLTVGDWQLVLLQSSIARRIDGAVSAADIERVRTWLDSTDDGPVLIALHHQPVVVGSPWIDRYRLEAPAALLALVERHEQVRAVVWGHVHQAFETRLGKARMLACPSTAVNSQAGTLKFTEDPAGPACRWLELHADGRVETGLL